MKKIISVLIIAVMLIATVAVMIPASAERYAYIPNWATYKAEGKFKAYKADGTIFDLTTYHKQLTTTREDNLLSATRKAKGESALYISTVQFEINDDTKYEYYVKVRSNSSSSSKNMFGGVPFAISMDNVVYSLYGGFDNTNAFASAPSNDESFAIVIHGDYEDREPYVGEEYMSDPKYFKELELDSEGFASLKFVYEGMTVKSYVKTTEGEFEQIADEVELVYGSMLAFGLFSRNGDTSADRTVSIKDAKILALNEEAMSAIEASGEEFSDEGLIGEIEDLISQIGTELSKDDYTEDSWESLELAIRSAREIMEDDLSLEDDLIMAKEDIEAAIDALVPVTDVDNGDNAPATQAPTNDASEDPTDAPETNAPEEDEPSDEPEDEPSDEPEDEPEDEPSDEPEEEPSDEPADDATEDQLQTETNAESASETAAATKKTSKSSGGCGAAVATTAVIVGIVSTLGTALVIKKKD